MKVFIFLIVLFVLSILFLLLSFLMFGVYIVATRLGMPTLEPAMAGFWLGLWQGLIVFLSFITSLFDHNITIYQVGNTGGWYNFGYLLGASISLGGCGIASKK